MALYALSVTKRAFPSNFGRQDGRTKDVEKDRERERSVERFGAEGRIGRMYN